MSKNGPLLPERAHIPDIKAGTSVDPTVEVLSTQDHVIIRRWAARRQAEPATGEATKTGPATVDVKDGGAGIRFNFPGRGLFRPITWEEWFENFERHHLAFVYDNDTSDTPPSHRYRLVKADDWTNVIG
jgi:hypothetical protein